MAPRPLTWPGKRSKQPSLRPRAAPFALSRSSRLKPALGPKGLLNRGAIGNRRPEGGTLGQRQGHGGGMQRRPFFGAAAANRPASRAQIHFVGARRTGVERARPFSGRPTQRQGEWGPDATDGLQCRRPKRCGGILCIRWEFRSDAPKPIRLRGGGIGNHHPFLWRFFQFPFYYS